MDITCPCGCNHGKRVHPVFGSESTCAICDGTGRLTLIRATELGLESLYKEEREKERQAYMNNLKELARPLIKWINENGSPYTNILISYDSVKVLSQEIGISIPDYIGD